jgi:hypothetical protein
VGWCRIREGFSGTKVPPPVRRQWHFSATVVSRNLIYRGSTSRTSGCFFQSGTGVLQPAGHITRSFDELILVNVPRAIAKCFADFDSDDEL